MNELHAVLEKIGLTNVGPYLGPVDKRALRALLQQGESFGFGGQSLPLPLQEELTFEFGASQLNVQHFFSVVNLSEAEGLRSLLSRKWAYKVTPENTACALLTERRFDPRLSQQLASPVWRFEDVLLSTRLDGDEFSHHLLKGSEMNSIVISRPTNGRLEAHISKLNLLLSRPHGAILGLNDSALTWNGKEWGVAEFSINHLFSVGGRTVGKGRMANFQTANAGSALRAALGGRHDEFEDSRSGLVIPGAANAPGRSGMPDWFMQQSGVPMAVTADGGGGYTGGGSSHGGSSTVWTFSGTGTCAGRTYSNQENCYECCDAMGGGALATGIAATVAITAGVASWLVPGGSAVGPLGTLAGIAVTAVVAVVLVGVSAGGAYALTRACQDACDRPTGHNVHTNSGVT